MTNEQKRMKKYMTAIERRLNLPREVRARVMSDLQCSVAARRVAGQTYDAIFGELGTPKSVAAELNEQMKEYAYTKSTWRWAALAGMIVAAWKLIFQSLAGLIVCLVNLSFRESASLGIIGGADGPTAIFVTTAAVGYRWILWVLVMVMCAVGWWKLSHGTPGETE